MNGCLKTQKKSTYVDYKEYRYERYVYNKNKKYNSIPAVTKKWKDKLLSIGDTCRTERALLDMATTQGDLLLLVNYDWIFAENVELFKQRLQGV